MQLSPQALRPDTEVWLQQRPAECEERLLVGQQRALDALTQSMRQRGCYANVFAVIPAGLQKQYVLDEYFHDHQWQHSLWCVCAGSQTPLLANSIAPPLDLL